MPTLRPYQSRTVRAVEKAFAMGHHRLCVQVPTGGGKTVIAAEVVRRSGRRVLYVVPSVEILEQTNAKLRAVGLIPELMQAGKWPTLHRQRVVLAMAQTLQRRLDSIHEAPWYPDLVIVDEAHKLLDAHSKMLAAFPVPSIALTATPVRLDGKPLGVIWPVLIEGPSVPALQKAGALCDVRTIEWPIADLRGIRVRAGDWDSGEMEQRLLQNHAPGQVAAAWARHLRGRRTIAFAPGRTLSQQLVRALKAAGARAVHVDATTHPDERARVLKLLAAGKLDVVSNCGLFIEGLDVPNVDGVIDCAPTMSVSRWLQKAGRGMRPAHGKRDLILIDHGGCTARLGAVDARRDWTLGGMPV